ncbi:MAG TPA: hypothetical protein VGG27_19645 [Magnetospirillaceae bacterium]|jgi:hypothetical protein
MRSFLVGAAFLLLGSIVAKAEELPYGSGDVRLGMTEDDYVSQKLGERTADPDANAHHYWRLVPIGNKNWVEYTTFSYGILAAVALQNGTSIKTTDGEKKVGDYQFHSFDRLSCKHEFDRMRAEAEARYGKPMDALPPPKHSEPKTIIVDAEQYGAQFADRSLLAINFRREIRTNEEPSRIIANQCEIIFGTILKTPPHKPTNSSQHEQG